MAKMRAIDAAVRILEREGVVCAFGVPGAAINPLYSALRKRGSINHILARHVEGASHMAEGYTRAKAGNIGVCIGTSGPAGTDMITGLYSAIADSIPILCVTGQAPRARLYKEDFQAVDIESISKPVTKWSFTVREPAQVPRAFQQAFHLMRSGRPGPVLIEFAELMNVPVIPTLMGWGAIPDDHRLMAGMVGLQTSHRYGNATFLASDFVIGIGNRWANRHTGSPEVYCKGRTFVHVDIEPTQIGRVFMPDLGIVSDAKAALELFVEVARERKAAGKLRDRGEWVEQCRMRKRTMLRKTNFDQEPMKPQRVYQCMNNAFGRDATYVSSIGLSQIAGAQFLHVFKPRSWINCGQAGPLGWTVPAALGVRVADPSRKIVALSGDYDFQFMIEELAVGAQFKLPYIHMVVNNSYLGLIRQAQRGFNMDYCVQLGFENINAPEVGAYGVDHQAVVEGLGCKAIRVHKPEEIRPAIRKAEQWMAEFQVPVVIEVILERVTNIAMGTEVDAITEFEELAMNPSDSPTAIGLLD